jgi:hypothetical protein
MAKTNLWLAAALLGGLCSSVFAQNAISAKAGFVQVADGEVFVNNVAVENKVAQFTDLKNSDVLTTGDGRTEVLLTPGAFLRMTDGSGIRMVSTRLSDVRMEMVRGETIVEVAELLTDNSITMSIGSASFELRKGGIYRFDSTPGRIRVFQGEALATEGEKTVTVKAGHEFASNGTTWVLGHFDVKETDALYRWSSRRSGDISVANVSAARQGGAGYGSYSGFLNTGLYGGGYGYGSGMYGMGGNWMFNPYFGMYTFMPFYDTAWSPFGYAYYTPITVGSVYAYTPRQGGTPVTAPGKGVPGVPGRTNPVRPTPAFTSGSALRASTVTRGTSLGFYRSSAPGSRTSYASSYSGGSYLGSASSNTAVSNSVAVSSSAGRSGGGGGGAASSGGGGGGTRGH